MKITVGKLRGLRHISTTDGLFIIAALDHRNSLKQLISPTEPDSVSSTMLKNVKTEFTKILAPHVSAVLLDPEYGIEASKKSVRRSTGLIMSLERSGYAEKRGRRLTKLLEDWNITKLKELNVNAVKLLVYYRPGESREQLKLVKSVAGTCKKLDVTFICEPFVYPLKGEKNFKKQLSTFVIDTAKELSETGVDLLKVQFPGDVNLQTSDELRKNCLELDSVCKVPWVLLSGGKKFDEFLKEVEIASRCNSSGIMVGRALWQEAFKKNSLGEVLNFVNVDSLMRLNRLSSIVMRTGSPWFERFNDSK